MSAAAAAQEVRQLATALAEAKAQLAQARAALADLEGNTSSSAAAIAELRARLEASRSASERLGERLSQATDALKAQGDAADGAARKVAAAQAVWAAGAPTLASSAARVRELAQNFGAAGASGLAAGDRLRAFAGASASAMSAASGLAGQLVALAEAAQQARANTEAAAQRQRELGSAMREVQRATGGAATDLQAYAARAALLDAGVEVTDQAIATLVESARRHKRANESVEASMARVTAAAGGSAAAQRELRISIAAGASAQEAMAQAVRQLAAENERLGPSVDTAADAQARANRNWERGRDAVVGLAADVFGITAITSVVQALGAGTEAAATALRSARTETQQGAGAASSATTAQRALSTEVGKTGVAHQRTKDQIQEMNRALHAQRTAANAAREAQKAFAESLDQVALAARRGERATATVARNARAALIAAEQARDNRRTAREARRVALAEARRRGLRVRRADIDSALQIESTPGDTAAQLREARERFGLQQEEMENVSDLRPLALRDGRSDITTRAALLARVERDAFDHLRRRGETEVGLLTRRREAYERLIALRREDAELARRNLAIDEQLARAEYQRAIERDAAREQAVTDRLAGLSQSSDAFRDLRAGIGRQAFLQRQSSGALRSLQTGGSSEADVLARIAALESASQGALSEGGAESQQRAAQYLQEAQALAGVIDQHRALVEALREGSSASLQFAEAFAGSRDAALAQVAPMRELATTSKGAFDVMSSSASNAFSTVIEGGPDAEKALAQVGRGMLKSLAEYFFGRALGEVGLSIGAFAIGNVPGGTAHAASAAALFGAAAFAGGAYAATAPPPEPTPASRRDAAPARGSDTRGSEARSETHVYNFNGLVTETQAAASLKRVLDKGRRRGVSPNGS
jgi:hypothetical protein